MFFMSDLHTYDAQVEAIQAYNQPILDEFRSWLAQSTLAPKTADRYVSNIQLFTLYLVYYDPLRRLDEASSWDVHMFLASWFPRKVGWSRNGITLHLASFKKFFQWMGETGRVSPETVADVLTTLKKNRNDFLEHPDKWSSHYIS
jgi:site-specific recombinase XerD